jgi:polyisoprenoid-binding protein YceI
LKKMRIKKFLVFLTIAGVTKKITTPVVFYQKDQTITLKGIQKLNMTDFGVKPPKAFLGLLKTRKMIDIDFTLKFKSNFWFSREP